MRPLLVTSIFSCVVVLPLALEVCTELMGFLGSAVAYVIFQATQVTLLMIYLVWKRPHVAETWPGIGCWKESLEWEPMMEYLHLGAGGMFAQSEWIYWEALGLIIGKMGVLELSVYTIPNQVVMAMCMSPFAFGIALAIRMGVTFNTSVARVQQIVLTTLVASAILFGLVTIAMYVCSDAIFSVFTNDPEVLGLAHKIWWKVCVLNFNVAIFGILTGIATGLGAQWTLGAVNFFFLWGFGIPVTYYFAWLQGGGLETAWNWINPPYTCMNISLCAIFTTTDWYKVQEKIKSGEIVDFSAELEPRYHHNTGMLPTTTTNQDATEITSLLR